MGLRGWIIPQERQFFDLLEKLAATVDEGAIALADLLHDFRDVPMKCRRIKDVEHHGDEIVHRVYEELNKTFITPIDREDIQSSPPSSTMSSTWSRRPRAGSASTKLIVRPRRWCSSEM